MKESTEQRLDELTKKVMNSTKLESPSSNFTENIMAHIENLEIEPTVQKPLISRLGWFIIGIILTGIILYNFFIGFQSTGWFESIDLSVMENNKISEAFSSISISKTMMYSAVLFGLFLLIQMSYLKNYFDKRFQY